jgi:hypothetical protein
LVAVAAEVAAEQSAYVVDAIGTKATLQPFGFFSTIFQGIKGKHSKRRAPALEFRERKSFASQLVSLLLIGYPFLPRDFCTAWKHTSNSNRKDWGT